MLANLHKRRLLVFLVISLVVFTGLNLYTGSEAIAGETTALDWEPAEWARKAVFYEVFVRSFYDGNGDGIGDFVGLKEKIPYFKELGVDTLWLMPVNDSQSYHGYDVVDYYNTEPDYGTLEEFREFLQEAHANGLKVIMDLVLNHTSVNHYWFREAVNTRDSKYRDYYVWAENEEQVKELGPWGQPVWHRSPDGGYYYGLFWSGMPDLNYRNPEVRAEAKKIAKFWLDPNGDGDFSDGVDGFRLDAALHIDKDLTITHQWWQEFNTFVKGINPEAFLVGENWTDTHTVGEFFRDLDASFNFALADEILRMVNGVPVDILEEVKEIHGVYSQYSDQYIDAIFLRNHDQNRVGIEVLRNRAKMKLAASVLFTLPGTPFIYYGEELGQLGAKPDDNIREPFDWYKDSKGPGMTTMSKGGFYHSMRFTKPHDGISLEEERGKSGSVYEHYKKLIHIRKEHPQFFTGNYQKMVTPNRMYGYKVTDSEVDYNLYVIHNLSNKERGITISNRARDLLSGKTIKAHQGITLPPYGSLILKTTAASLKITGQDLSTKNPVVTFIVELTDKARTDEDIYLASKLSNWQVDDKFKLKKRSDGKYEITLEQPAGAALIFKFKTPGTWEDTSGRENEGDNRFQGSGYNNRIYTFENKETVYLTITGWE
ncbi:alpha-amylase family glycosyl hydrolase [Halothermothrix orenii]|uniref:Alpha-amylase n=1 Tax=Halothermothrix orenii (strain H 168 / OCM 544 / DSM 9562) TaxID=373903 RepID=B8D1B3_HALOH|nr:alpha-amylase family glycosyl hydrolase [Halothermothrix orenii]ACL71065.1 alpha amylase [Halothermothrix orenii H 168]